METLVVFGYLKPNDLKHETEKGSSPTLLNIYQLIYLLLAALIIVNFFVSIINDSHGKATTVVRDKDIIDFVCAKAKELKVVNTNRLKAIYDKRIRKTIGYNGELIERNISHISAVLKDSQ